MGIDLCMLRSLSTRTHTHTHTHCLYVPDLYLVLDSVFQPFNLSVGRKWFVDLRPHDAIHVHSISCDLVAIASVSFVKSVVRERRGREGEREGEEEGEGGREGGGREGEGGKNVLSMGRPQ